MGRRPFGYEPNGQKTASLYLDPRWQKKRLEIMQRDQFTCQCCHATDKTLHVHHIYYTDWAKGPWDYFDKALITLCEECHEKEHQGLKSSTEFIMSNLAALGINTTEKMDRFGEFLENLRIGSVDETARDLAAVFVKELWDNLEREAGHAKN